MMTQCIRHSTVLVVLMSLSPFAAAQAEKTSDATPAATTPAARSAPVAAASASVPALRKQANEAYRSKDYTAFRNAVLQLQAQRPYNATYMSLVVVAHALNGDNSKAYEMMLAMQQQGLSHDFNESADTESIRGTEAYSYINDLLVRANEPAGAAELMFELPASLLLPTDIAWDPTRNAYLVSNARDGAVYKVAEDGSTETLLSANADNGLWAIFGLWVDEASNRLWVSSSATESFSGFDKADAGRAALFEFTLDKLALVKKYPVAQDKRPHRLGGVVKAGDGNLYAVDTILPIIYRLKAGEEQLRPFVASADMVSMRGITVSDNGQLLYVADYEMGIMVFDLLGKRAMRLSGPENLNLGGIEGLFYWNGHLVTIQNGNPPQRVMRLKLSADGASVDDVAPLAIAQPFFDYPNFGTVRDARLVFFANSHWIRNLSEPKPVRVAATQLEGAPNLAAPDVDKFWDEYYEKTGQERPAEGGQ